MRLPDEVLKHFLRHFKIRDDPVLHRADRDDVARRAAQHLLRVTADRLNLIRDLIDRNDRRLTHHDAPSLRINQRIGRSEIDRKVTGKQTE